MNIDEIILCLIRLCNGPREPKEVRNMAKICLEL